MDIVERLGRRVRELRKRKRLTQTELAEKAGIDPKYIGQIERGETNPTVRLLANIAQALDISLAELFTFPQEVEEEEFEDIRVLDIVRNKPPEMRKMMLRIIKVMSD